MAVLTLIMTSGMGPLMIRSFKLEQERRKSMKWVKGQEVGKLHSSPPPGLRADPSPHQDTLGLSGPLEVACSDVVT